MKFLVAYKHFREYTLTSTARERSRQEGRLVEEIEVVGNSQWALSNSYILADLAWRLSFATSSDNRVRKNRTPSPSPTWLWSLSTSLPSRAVTPGRSSCQCGSSRHHQRPIFLCASVGCPSFTTPGTLSVQSKVSQHRKHRRCLTSSGSTWVHLHSRFE